MKLEKDELKAKVGELVQDNDIAIQLLEDIEDSMGKEDTSKIDELQNKLNDTQARLDDMQEKYKQRFLDGDTKEEPKQERNELVEKEYIDIKEI